MRHFHPSNDIIQQGILRESDSYFKASPSTFDVAAQEPNVLPGQQSHPLSHDLQIFTDASGSLIYKLPGLTKGLLGPKSVLRPLVKQNYPCSYRQHHSCLLHKRSRRHEVGYTLYPTKNPHMVLQETDISEGPTHHRLTKYGR